MLPSGRWWFYVRKLVEKKGVTFFGLKLRLRENRVWMCTQVIRMLLVTLHWVNCWKCRPCWRHNLALLIGESWTDATSFRRFTRSKAFIILSFSCERFSLVSAYTTFFNKLLTLSPRRRIHDYCSETLLQNDWYERTDNKSIRVTGSRMTEYKHYRRQRTWTCGYATTFKLDFLVNKASNQKMLFLFLSRRIITCLMVTPSMKIFSNTFGSRL